MSAAFERVIDEIEELSQEEKALVAHRLLESLDTKQEQGAEQAWKDLSDQRLKSMKSGEVQGVAWKSVKKHITSG
ncbi:MAG: addiction module protein [Neptuniibacter sp.]